MRHVFAVLGCIAALIMLCVSAAMNWQYGYSLGETEFNAYVLGAASIAADCLKALLPFFIYAAWRQRNWSQAISGTALWAVCILYALTSAIGFASTNRNDTTGARAMQAVKFEDVRAQLGRIGEQQKWLEKHRSVGMVEAELDAAKQHYRWATSESCTNATIPESRAFCESYHKLHAELAAAKKDQALQQEADALRAQLSQMDGRAAGKAADPQATMIASLFGIDIKQVELGLIILITLLVELGSSMGLFVATSTWRVHEVFRKPAPQTEPARVVEIMEPVRLQAVPDVRREQQLSLPKSDIEIYFEDRIRQDDGASITALSLYDNYCEWCDTTGRSPVGLPIFSRQLTDLGVQKAKIAGKIRYIGIRVAGSGHNEDDGDMAAVS
jgi:hypothetical protein